MDLSDSSILLVSIPVILMMLLVFFLFVLTAVEARKVAVSKSVPDEDKEEPLETNNSPAIEEDLGEFYAPIPVEYREDILSNIKKKQSISASAQSQADSDSPASTLLQLWVSRGSLSEEKVTDAIEVIQAEEADQVDEVGRTPPRPSTNALKRRRKSSRMGYL